jgi:quinoprotein glucose dehydrogenase
MLAALALLVAQEAAPMEEGEEGDERDEFASNVEPASDEGQLAIEGFEVAEGFEVELFAAEPMLANPVCLYVDHSGDVYVAETFRHFAGVTDMREHMDWLDDDTANQTVGERLAMLQKYEGEAFADYARATDRVKWIRDNDGDGRADVDVVFAEGFDKHEAGIGAGLLSYRGDVYYTCIPDLWRLRDEDGNRRADVREVLSTGYGVNIALLGHDLHGLRIGPDGLLYFSCGDRGFHVETPNGTIEHAHTGAVLRCNLDGSDLEVFATGLRNPQELVFDEYGNLFTGDNNSDGGDEARWVHVIEGMDAGWRYGYQFLTEPNLRGPWNDEKLWHPRHEGQAAYIVPPIANFADGPSGLTYNPGTGMPPEYDGHFFLCDFRGDPNYSGIHTFTVEPKGASFEMGPAKRLIWNTLVTDCDFGPDGALYFTDWVQSWDKTGKGRVYRLFAPDARAVETAKLLKEGMGGREVDALVELLGHADQRVRQEAQFELVRREESFTLGNVWLWYRGTPHSDLARLHAFWGSQMTTPHIRPLLPFAEPFEPIRVQIAKAWGDAGAFTQADGAYSIPHLLLEDGDTDAVMAQAAIALGKMRDPAGVEPLFELLRTRGTDPVMRHAAVMGLAGCASVDEILAGAEGQPHHVRLGAVVALRRTRAASIVEFLKDEDPLVVLEAARAIYDVPIPEGTEELAWLFEQEALGYALGRRVINACFRAGGGLGAEALARVAHDPTQDERLRVEAVELLGRWETPPGRDGVTGEWRPLEPRSIDAVTSAVAGPMWATALKSPHDFCFLETKFADAPPAVARAWIELFVDLSLEDMDGLLAALAGETEREPAVRVAAIEALGSFESELRGEVAAATLFDRESAVRAAALELLQGVSPEDALPLLVDAARKGERAERRTAYRILAELASEEADAALVEAFEALARDELPGELALDLVAAAEARDTPRLNALLEAHRSGRSDEVLAPFVDGLLGGDAERGRELFLERADLQCLRCHRDPASEDEVVDEQVGPDLRGLGTRSTRLQMLESIVDPNRRITTGYQGTLFFLEDETRVEGQVLSEDGELIRVLDADGVVHELEAAAVETRRAGLSAMPAGMGALVTRHEMRDLIEYLSSL